MKRQKRVCALVLALVLLAGCSPQRTEPLPYPDPAASEPEKIIAYVPLDDRPDNVERVVYLAESIGYALAMPDRDLYRTVLDRQPKNSNGTQCGDPWALSQWVLEQEAAGCDRYILSLDQLHSGGLVASRCASRYDVDVPDGEPVNLAGMLEDLLETLAEDPDNVVWLLDSVMRLAPTVGYEGGRLETYNWIRAFGAQPRGTLKGEELTMEAVWDSYWWGPNQENLYNQTAEVMGAVSAEDFYGPSRALEDNLQSRERKLQFSDGVQKLLAQPGYENFRLLIGIDDSSLEDCIQKNEIAYLRQGLRMDSEGKQMDWILSGVDDLAFKAVTRLYLDETEDETDWPGYGVSVQYFGGTEDKPACEYDFQPLWKIVREHFQFFGLSFDRTASLNLLVLTQPKDEVQKQFYIDQLLKTLEYRRKNQQPTILIDASNGTYGAAVYEALTKKTELGCLLAYSGMLDMAIVTGTALSHGVARYAVLRNWGGTDYMDRAWARTLADSILKDFCYKGVVRNDLLAYIRNDLGGDPNNFWDPELDLEDLLERLENGMEKETAAVIKNLEKSSFVSVLDYSNTGGGHTVKHWGGIALENYRFPWDRAFEIGMDIRLGEFTYN